MTAHSVLNVRAALEWGNSELYKYYERNGLGYGIVQYNLNLKVKKKKQFNCTNPNPWARNVGSRNTAAIYMNGVATTALFDTGA